MERNEFRKLIFQRDKNLCVVCGRNAVDAHHIIERRLWSDGGYYVDNGASLCKDCHIQAEQTVLSCEEIRKCAGITKIITPPLFYEDEKIDKWGNQILDNGKRTIGPLFYDNSVQKILEPVLHLFIRYSKYPRTPHLPWSPGLTNDERVIEDLSILKNSEIVVSLKRDGENTTMYNDYIHARSLDSRSNFTRNWIKNFHAKIKEDIPKGWRICGENLWAKHSIEYNNLYSYFESFLVIDEKNQCLSYDETIEWLSLLDILHTPILYTGKWDEEILKSLLKPKFENEEMEGFVIRNRSSFYIKDFSKNMAKVVRKDHIRTSHHWLKEIHQNKIK